MFHILMPFSREQTIEFYINEFRQLNIIWHPISEKPYNWPKENWIQPLVYNKTGIPTKLLPFFALKEFFEKHKIIDNDYYFELSDDDFLEPNFFNKLNNRRKFCDIDSHVDTDFVVVSLMRGHNKVPTSGYPNDILIAHPDNMRLYWVSLSQIIMKGKVYKNTYLQFLKINDHILQQMILLDGLYIQYLWNTYPGGCFTFVPEVYQWFNYLEPGRWNHTMYLNHKYINIHNL